jgi:hypothetical protein
MYDGEMNSSQIEGDMETYRQVDPVQPATTASGRIKCEKGQNIFSASSGCVQE